MIELATGDLLAADVQAIVNAVNTVGVMGKGLALQFKHAFPDNFKAYKAACDARELRAGKVFVFDRSEQFSPRYIINFPTKRHFRSPSRLEDIETGLQSLTAEVRARNIESIAVPALGCGLGGLDWNVVYPLILAAFEPLPDVRVLVFAPQG